MILFNEEKTVTSEEALPKVTLEIKFTKTSNMNVLPSSLLWFLVFILHPYIMVCLCLLQ